MKRPIARLVICLAIALHAELASAQDAPRVDPDALAAALAHYAHVEPPVDVVVEAVLREASRDLGELESLSTRARLSGLLPTIRVGARRGTGWDLSERLDDTGRIQLGTDDSLTLRGEAVFSLDRLVFAREEVPLAREERVSMRVRREIVRDAVRLYFERRRLMLERDLLDVRTVDHAVRIAEATALLNGFTGGAFGRMMARNRGRQESTQTVFGGGPGRARGRR